MYLIKESEARLNQQAITLKNEEVSFHINYWGIDSHLTYNPVHRHSSFEVCYVMDGVGKYLDDGIVYPLQKGALFCSRPMITHQIKSEEGLYLLWVCFELDEKNASPRYSEDFMTMGRQGNVVVYNASTSSSTLLWKSLLIPEKKQWSIPSHALPSIAHTLIVSFLDVFLERKVIDKQKLMKSSPILQRAKLFIIDNIEKDLSLKMVANYLNVSQRHLSRLFSEQGINENFVSFIRKERVKTARSLLETTTIPLKDIADKTGFGSVHYFTRVFRKETGVPPGVFRNNQSK